MDNKTYEYLKNRLVYSNDGEALKKIREIDAKYTSPFGSDSYYNELNRMKAWADPYETQRKDPQNLMGKEIAEFDKNNGDYDQIKDELTGKVYTRKQIKNMNWTDYLKDVESSLNLNTAQNISGALYDIGKNTGETMVDFAEGNIGMGLAKATNNSGILEAIGESTLTLAEGKGLKEATKAVSNVASSKDRAVPYVSNYADDLRENAGFDNNTLRTIGNVAGSVVGGITATASGIPAPVAYGGMAGLRAYGNTDDVGDIAVETGLGAVYGTIFRGVTNAIKGEATKALTGGLTKNAVYLSLLQNLGVNVGSNAVGGYSANAITGTARNVYDKLRNREVDWSKPIFSTDATINALVSGAIGGAMGTYADYKSIGYQAQQDTKKVLQMLDTFKKQMADSAKQGDLKGFRDAYAKGVTTIDLLNRISYMGVKLNPEDIADLLGAWNEQTSLINFTYALPSGSIPEYTTSTNAPTVVPPSSGTTTQNTPVVPFVQTPTVSNTQPNTNIVGNGLYEAILGQLDEAEINQEEFNIIDKNLGDVGGADMDWADYSTDETRDQAISKVFDEFVNSDEGKKFIAEYKEQPQPTTTATPRSNYAELYTPSQSTINTAKFSEERLNAYLKEWASEKMPNYSKAYATRMTPDDFLSLTANDSDIERIKTDNAKRTEKGWTLDNMKFDTEERTEPQAIKLTVDFETGEVLGHEGRHRMQALKDAGIKEADVVVMPYVDSYDRSNPERYIPEMAVTQQNGIKKPTKVLLKDLDVISYSNEDALKQKYLGKPNYNDVLYEPTNEDNTIKYSRNDGYERIYITKPVSETPREDWADTREIETKKGTVKLLDYKDVIENSMSMKEAEEMIKRAYIMDRDKSKANMELSHAQKHDIKSFNQYINEYPERLIGQDILRQGLLVNKYINHIKELKEIPELVEGVVLAYKNKALKGKLPIEEAKPVDVSKDQGTWKNHKDRRFYETGYAKAEETRQMTDGRETLRKATQRDNGFNRTSIKKARREFLINAHNKEWLKENNITAKKAYELTNEWASYKKTNADLVNKLNEGVAYENRWTGIENSTILSNGMISEDAIDSLGVSIKGEENKKLVNYIANTMLAIDTHQSWNNFVVRVATDRFDGHTGANYDYTSDTMTVFLNGQNTVSHEMGHRLDHSWAQDIFGRSGNKRVTHGYLTRRLTDETLEKVLDTEDERNFVRNFYNFLDDIGKNADFKNNYTINDTEVFARFVAKFVEWTFKKANNPLVDADNGWYRDKFTEKQFKDFVRILQEKSALDNKWGAYSISEEYKAFEDTSYILDMLQRVPEPFTKLAQDAFENNIDNKEGFIDTILQNKLKYVGEEALKEKEVDAIFMDKFADTEQFRHALGKAFDELSKRYKQYGKLGTYDYTQSLRNGFHDYGYMGVSQQAVVWNKKPTTETETSLSKANKDIARLEKANKELQDKMQKQADKYEKKLAKKEEELKDVKQSKKNALRKKTEQNKEKIKREKEERAIKRLEPEKRLPKLIAKAKAKQEEYAENGYPELSEKFENEFGKTIRDIISTLSNQKIMRKLPDKLRELITNYKNETYLKANWKTFDKYLKEAIVDKQLRDIINNSTTPVSDRLLRLIQEHNQAPVIIQNAQEMKQELDDLIELVNTVKQSLEFAKADAELEKTRENIKAELEPLIEKNMKTHNARSEIVDNVLNTLDKLKDTTITSIMFLPTRIQATMDGNPDSTLNILWKNIERGSETEMRLDVEKSRLFDKFFENPNSRNFKLKGKLAEDFEENPKWEETNTPVGKVTRLMMMSIYGMTMNKDNLMHITPVLLGVTEDGEPIYSKPGGLIIPEERAYKRGDISEAYANGKTVKLTQEDIDKIKNKLTPLEKEFVETCVKDVADFIAKEGNPVSMNLTGRELFHPNYLRILVSGDAIDSEMIDPTQTDRMSTYLANMDTGLEGRMGRGGSLQGRTHKSTRPIYLEDLWEATNNSVNSAIRYISYAEALYDNDLILKTKFPNTYKKVGEITEAEAKKKTFGARRYIEVDELPKNGNGTYIIDNGDGYDVYEVDTFGKKMETLIAASGDGEFMRYYKDYVKNLLFGNGDKTTLDKAVGKLAGMRARVVLNANINVGLAQQLSRPFMLEFAQLKSFIKGFIDKQKIFDIAEEYLKNVGGVDTSRLSKVDMLNRFLEFATYMKSYRGLGKYSQDAEALKNKKKGLGRIDLGWLMTMNDRSAVDFTFRVLIEDILDGRKEFTKEDMEELKKRAWQVARSNPSYLRAYKTPLQASKNVIARALSQFQTVTILGYNNFLYANMAEDYYSGGNGNGGDKGKAKEWGKKKRISGASIIVSGIMGAIIYELLSTLVGKEKIENFAERTLKTSISKILSYTIIGDEIYQWLMGEGYDLSTNDLGYTNQLKNSLSYMGKMFTAEESKKPSATINFVKSVGSMIGLPMNSLENIFTMVGNITDSNLGKEYKILKNSSALKKWLDKQEALDGTSMATYYDMYQATRESTLEAKYGYVKGSKSGTYSAKEYAIKRAIADVLGYPTKNLSAKQSEEIGRYYQIFK